MMIGNAELCEGLYILKPTPMLAPNLSFLIKSANVSSSISHLNNDAEIMLLHRSLGHPSFMYLERIFPELFRNKNPKLFNCDICQFSKHIRNSYSPRPYKSSNPFSTIHSDILGAFRMANVTGAHWFLILVDDHTRLCWVFLMKDKSETTKLIKDFHVMIKTQFNTNVQVFQ